MSTIVLKWWPKRFLVNPVKPFLFVILLVSMIGCTADDPGFYTSTADSKVQVIDSDGDIIGIDGSTRTLQTIEYEHHEIHEGSSYTIIDVVDMANGAVRDIQITVPNTTKLPHIVFSFVNESEVEWWVYEDVTINVAGAVVLMNNNNRNSTNLATTMLAEIDNANIAAANADTVVAAAVEIYHGMSGAGKDSGEHEHNHEIILKRNEEYTFRFVANAAGYVSYHIDWYEHTSKE